MAGRILTREEKDRPRLGAASDFLRRFVPGFDRTANEIGKRQQRQSDPTKKRKRKPRVRTSRKRMLDDL